jgi:CcmD family protein
MDGNYIAMIVTLIIWVGIFLFLNNLDKRVRKLEKRQ